MLEPGSGLIGLQSSVRSYVEKFNQKTLLSIWIGSGRQKAFAGLAWLAWLLPSTPGVVGNAGSLHVETM